MKQVFCLIVVLSLAVAGCRENLSYETVREKEFSGLSKQGNTVILDVRTPKEYEKGHLEEAILLNYKDENFQKGIEKLDKTKTYLVYCQAGGRSAKASEEISKTGLKTYNLEGGISNWTGKVVH